jgi:hypothetical protein
MIQKHLKILLHLNRVVFHLGHGEDAHLAILPSPVLLQQERQQHQKTTVVNDPPNIDIADDLEFLKQLRYNIYYIFSQGARRISWIKGGMIPMRIS